MNGLLKASILFLSIPLSIEVAAQTVEFENRGNYYVKAYMKSREYGKPMLVIGNPKGRHKCGDILLDINPRGECPVEVKGDVRDMYMFSDKEFGSIYVGHVLEHLHLNDALKAIDECRRVGHYIVILYPVKASIIARFHPDHKMETLNYLWSINPGGVIEFEE